MTLTKRESTVLALIASGHTDRHVAQILKFKTSTARKHRENLQFKLGADKSTKLVSHYFRINPEILKKSR